MSYFTDNNLPGAYNARAIKTKTGKIQGSYRHNLNSCHTCSMSFFCRQNLFQGQYLFFCFLQFCFPFFPLSLLLLGSQAMEIGSNYRIGRRRDVKRTLMVLSLLNRVKKHMYNACRIPISVLPLYFIPKKIISD